MYFGCKPAFSPERFIAGHKACRRFSGNAASTSLYAPRRPSMAGEVPEKRRQASRPHHSASDKRYVPIRSAVVTHCLTLPYPNGRSSGRVVAHKLRAKEDAVSSCSLAYSEVAKVTWFAGVRAMAGPSPAMDGRRRAYRDVLAACPAMALTPVNHNPVEGNETNINRGQR